MTADAESKILKKLEAQEKEEGSLPLLLQFYQKLLRVQSRARGRFGTPELALSSVAIQRRMGRGRPLLGFADLKLDWPQVQDLFARVINVFADYPQIFTEVPTPLREPGAGRFLTRKAAAAWFAGKQLPMSFPDGKSQSLAQAMVQAAMKPYLTAYARALKSVIGQEQWRRGYCPVCGGAPDLSYLDRERGSKWLVCSRCDTEWLFQRLECPFCGTKAPESLAFFTDEQELYRLYVCEACKCYLKAIDLRKTEAEALLPLERMYTIHLDVQAQQYGYKPHPSASDSHA